MSQHPYTIPNQLAPAARADINLALKALASTNSGASAPATTYSNQLWYDESANILKIRNEANSAWISLGVVDQSTQKFEPNFTAATAVEANAGVINDRAVTPLSLLGAFPNLLSQFQPAGANYITLSNGLVLTWGTGSIGGGSGAGVRVNLSTAFPTGFIAAFTSVVGGGAESLGISGWDRFGFTATKGGGDSAARSFLYLALGY